MLQAIDVEENETLKEMLLGAFFQLIRNQNMLCFFNTQADKLEPALSRKDFAPPKLPCENSIWGTDYGRGTFDSIIDKIIEGKTFCWEPTDRRFIEAVSYTHLDVYKRQAGGTPARVQRRGVSSQFEGAEHA